LELIILLRRKIVIVFISNGKVMHLKHRLFELCIANKHLTHNSMSPSKQKKWCLDSKVVRKIKSIKHKSRGCKEEKEMQIKI
jgi:hypothetical protein